MSRHQQYFDLDTISGPHEGQRVLSAGAPVAQADAVLVLTHGRGATAEDILSLGYELRNDSLALLAPQANQYTWYPASFLAPFEVNEPWLSSALQVLGAVVDYVVSEEGVSHQKIVLAGFSQGACLTLEYAARNPARYGGVAAFSGGLIGPPRTAFSYDGSLEGTPVFLGCSDVDPHIPLARVQESTAVLQGMAASVTERIYPRMGHTINQDEFSFFRQMVEAVEQAVG